MSDIRYDRLHDTHVIIAPERLHRPDCGITEEPETVPPQVCPFCEGNESMTPPEIYARRTAGSYPNEPGWQTRVVPNLYKAVQIEAPCQEHHHGMFEYWDGFGAHEIIIDTPHHRTSMTQWSTQEIAEWLKTLRERVADLRRDRRIVYISLFKNEGVFSGATQPHSHTQLIGLPIIPKTERERYRRCFDHYVGSGNAMLASLLLQEEEAGTRVIAKSGEFTAFCPFASAYPFEVMISSQKALGQVDTISDETIGTLAPLLLSTLKRVTRQLGCFDFNLSISTPPLQAGIGANDFAANIDRVCRFMIRIMPRIYRHGGFEVSTGVLINPVSPELAAKLLRESDDA